MRVGYNETTPMNTIEADGKTYIKAADAARAVGYTADYVGQLCRKGSIDARFVGRSWYVKEGELERQKKSKARTNTEKTIKEMERKLEITEEAERKIHKTVYVPGVTPLYRKRILETPISYTTDEGDTVPSPSRIVEEPETFTPKEETKNENESNQTEDVSASRNTAVDSHVEEVVTETEELKEETPEPTTRWEVPEPVWNEELPVARKSLLPVLATAMAGFVLVLSAFFVESNWTYNLTDDTRTLSRQSSFESGFNLASLGAVVESLKTIF